MHRTYPYTPYRTRPLIWPWALGVGCGAPILGFLVLFAYLTVICRPQYDTRPPLFSIHASDVVTRNADGTPARVRCVLCSGGGRTYFFAPDGHIGGTTVCPSCDGSGVMDAGKMNYEWKEVPNDQPSSYPPTQ